MHLPAHVGSLLICNGLAVSLARFGRAKNPISSTGTLTDACGKSLTASYLAILFAWCLGLSVSDAMASSSVGRPLEQTWTAAQWNIIQSFSISELPEKPLDPSNTYQHNALAASFGKKLFFDTALSATGSISCASCHRPEFFFTDKRPLAQGLKSSKRHTPSLLFVAYQDWFFWDGRKDSLWAQVITPFESPNEHGLTRTEVVRIIASRADYRDSYEQVFSTLPKKSALEKWPNKASPEGDQNEILAWQSLPLQDRHAIDRIYANIGKSLAAYVATLKSSPSKLDLYIDELRQSGRSALLSDDEESGLRLFIDVDTGCSNCHNGPLLTNHGFHDIGTGITGRDLGRGDIVATIAWDRFNCLGKYSDAATDECDKLTYINKNRHENSGLFKVPGLRNVADTAPYMHDGRFQTLDAVVNHYVQTSNSSTPGHLPAVTLTADEQRQIAAFLGTLSLP